MDKLKIPVKLNCLFAPLQTDTAFVIGQLGQSLDGRIATETGHSKYISGKDGLLHLHRLRSLCDAVVVGVGTVIADDPQLNLRLCGGKNPVRIIIDPKGRVPLNAQALRDDGTKCIVVTTAYSKIRFDNHIERIDFSVENGSICPHKMIETLANKGFGKLLIEGGAYTISQFLSAGALDRLHITVSPLIIGSGKLGINLAPVNFLNEALRPETDFYKVGKDIIFDCAFKQG